VIVLQLPQISGNAGTYLPDLLENRQFEELKPMVRKHLTSSGRRSTLAAHCNPFII